MYEADYLNLKTTNINIRISPILKSQLIERGAKMGVNLSDYIGHVLTKDMSGQNDPKQSEEYKELMKKQQKLQAELSRFQAIAEPFKEWLNKEVIISGRQYHFQHSAEMLEYIVKSFKIKP
jgi:hypothetical protein